MPLRNKKLLSLTGLLFLFISCTTKVYVSPQQETAGKRIAIGDIKLDAYSYKSKQKIDTLCDCVASHMKYSMYPFFQEAGLTLVDLPLTPKQLKGLDLKPMIDSLHIDYIMTGTGLVEVMGKSYFMHSLSVTTIEVKTGHVVSSGFFEGPSVTPEGAIRKIGKHFVKAMKRK